MFSSGNGIDVLWGGRYAARALRGPAFAGATVEESLLPPPIPPIGFPGTFLFSTSGVFAVWEAYCDA